MSKDKSGGNNRGTPVQQPSRGGIGADTGNRSKGESTNPVNRGGKSSQTTTGSTGPKGPANKK